MKSVTLLVGGVKGHKNCDQKFGEKKTYRFQKKPYGTLTEPIEPNPPPPPNKKTNRTYRTD